MSAIVFVDTNIFVYARDAGETEKQPVAAEWIRKLWSEQRGRTSMQVLSEYFTTVTRKLDPGISADEAWEDVTTLFAWEPQEINRTVLVRSREIERRYALNWWDALIVAAAQLQNCSLLVSEDLQNGFVCGSVTVRNPFAASVAEESAAYSTARVSRHKGRGRPRLAAG
jgi:predicted nucleic acid-binding protein